MRRESPYGWVVVLCAFTLMFLGFGAAYSFAAFFRAFESEFGASRAHVSLVFSLCAFLYFLLGAPGGMLADRYGTRSVALAGVACLAAGLAAASYANSVAVLYATYSIGLGIGAGNLLVPPLAAWGIGALGWRGAYLALAACALVLGGAAALAIRNRPAGQARATSGVTLRAGIRTRNFWVLYATLVLSGFGCFVPMVHIGPYAMDAGHPESFAVLLVSLIGLGSLAGRFAIGGIAERYGRMQSLALTCLGMAAMLLLWWGSTGAIALSAMAVGFGVSYGAFVATFPTVVMDLFGPRSVAGIIGSLYTGAGVGTLFGPPVAGAAYDATGSYAAPILGAAALAFAAAASVRLLRAPAA